MRKTPGQRPGATPLGGAAGNRTRVLRHRARASPCAVCDRSVSRPSGLRKRIRTMGPASGRSPVEAPEARPRRQVPLVDASHRARDGARADRHALASLRSEGVVALSVLLGAYEIAATLQRWSPACTGTLPLARSTESNPISPVQPLPRTQPGDASGGVRRLAEDRYYPCRFRQTTPLVARLFARDLARFTRNGSFSSYKFRRQYTDLTRSSPLSAEVRRVGGHMGPLRPIPKRLDVSP